MKQQYRSLMLATSAVLIAGAQTSNASPLVSVGDNTDIFFNGSSSIQSTSNVYKNEDVEEDDVILVFTPGFEVNVGRGESNVDLTLLTNYTIKRYSSEDSQDNELFSTRLTGSYEASRLQLSALASFTELKSNTGDGNVFNDLIESDVTALSFGGEYEFSPKFSFGAEIKYNDREYQSPYAGVLADTESVTVPLDLYYELTPKVDLSFGYQFQDREVGAAGAVSSYDQENHFFSVGARGELAPKLTGFFKVGLKTADNDDRTVGLATVEGEDDSTIGLDASLTYLATPKVTIRAAAGRDFDAGSEGQSVESTRLNLTGTYVINANYSATAGLRYNFRDYDTNREDDQIGFNARLNYSLNEYWNFSGGYSYDDNDSDRAGSSYTEHLFDLTASLRY